MKRIISVILAAMMLLMIAPTAAHGKRAESRAPYGYVEHEYDQLLAFMEQTNSAGVKNGTQLSSAYDPNDPETWGGIFWYIAPTGFIHAEYIFFSTYDFPNRNLVGTLNLSGFSKLRAFGCAGNSITAVSISDCPLLDELNVAQNLLTNFSVSNCAELRLVWCEENMLPSVSMSNLPKLRQFHCYQNPITELDVSPFENLWYLFCGNTGISQIDVSRNPQLRELRCENTHLTSIDVSKCENLTDLFCNNTDISELDISNNPALARLFCNNTDISVLDLSQNTNIDKLRCYDAKLMSLEWKCIIPGLSLDITLLSEGDGYVGVDWERVYVSDNYWENRITAVATPNGTFRGWYMGESLVSSSLRLPLGADIDIPATMLTAKFDGTTPIPPTPTPLVSPEPPTPTPPPAQEDEPTIYGFWVSERIPNDPEFHTNWYTWSSFNADSPEEVTMHCGMPAETGSGYSSLVAAAAYHDGYIYGYTGHNNFFRVRFDDMVAGETTQQYFLDTNFAQNGGFNVLDMEYDYSRNKMFAILQNSSDGTQCICEVDLETGNMLNLESGGIPLPYMNNGEGIPYTMQTLAIDLQGNAYCMAMGFSVSELCSLDLDTGMYETIMTVPAKSYDYQSMTMDHSTGHIYWAQYATFSETWNPSNLLFKIDLQTMQAESKGTIGHGSQWTGMFIPYDSGQPPVTGILGDVDGNGIVQIADAILAARHALGVYLLEGESLILADVDMNGEITIADAVLIMRIAMGLYEP